MTETDLEAVTLVYALLDRLAAADVVTATLIAERLLGQLAPIAARSSHDPAALPDDARIAMAERRPSTTRH